MGEWKRVKLGEICSKIGSGATPTGGKSAYKDDGVSLIRSQNVLDMSFAMAGLAHIDDEQARKLDGVTVCGGDVLLNITGDSVARCCIVPDHVLPARVNQHVCILRPRPDLAENRFVEYFLIAIKDRLLTLASAGATRNALTKETIQNLEVSLPDLPTQRRIVAVLGALDDKIEVNRKICENLEAQAQALFKAWFVDFEPFGGKRPEGWKMGKLGDVADCNQRSYSAKEEWQEVSYLDTGSITKNVIAEVQLLPMDKAPSRARRKVRQYSIVYSTVRPNLCHYGIIVDVKENMLVSTGFAVVDAKEGYSPFHAYLALTSEDVTKKLHALAEQSVCTYPALNPEDVMAVDILIPTLDIEKRFDNLARPMFDLAEKKSQESRALAAMRDALLPKLMSGELAVEKVEVAERVTLKG